MSPLFVYSLDFARTRLANDAKGKGGERQFKDASVAASLLLGWAVTVTAGLMAYPIDTVRRRMMMTSGGGVKYKGSIDCATQVLKNEGFMSLMKGAGANVLRGVAGAGVLAGFDKFQAMYIAWRTSQ